MEFTPFRLASKLYTPYSISCRANSPPNRNHRGKQ
uniref:Uncharacterized protein n=1 Tax=Myoviridae sp. ctw4b6 TaxID=2825206 RepID=A0A8S5QDN8_9CAUD|nr:MAG TPA: hypothetical protein [Myoviridae sp. ctw4b6]